MSQAPRYAPFHETITAGEATEKRVADAFRQGGCEVHHDGDGGRRDLWIIKDGLPYWVEVKDETNQRTKNLCIEFGQSEPMKPSGMSVSESQIWVHVFVADCVIYRMRPMLTFVRQRVATGQYREEIYGDNKNRNVIVPRLDFDHYPWAESCAMADIVKSRVFARSTTRR